MIVLLKIHASGKLFYRICQNFAVRDTFFPNIWNEIRRQGNSNYPAEREIESLNFSVC